MASVNIVSVARERPSWTDRLVGPAWYHWGRLEKLLGTNLRWQPQQLESLAAESLRILRRLHDPHQDAPFQSRGLVVGYVQSGKTANYTALAARAADAGYRIVIVLSGIHDSLRNQTQNRLERELTGHQAVPGLSRAEVGKEWTSLTSPTEDFQEQDERILQSPAPFLAVVKKHVVVLQKLDRWLKSAERYLHDMPILVIDDEADQASINTRGNRPLDPAVSDEEEDGDEGERPSPTNDLIRSILSRARKAAYVAYTATPFANILINPEAVDRRVGIDLFPKDFVIQLPRPDGYTGTEELFGVSAKDREVLRTVPVSDVSALRAKRQSKDSEIVVRSEATELPKSLAEALISFCLVGAVRSLRGLTGKAHTMLVHVSHRTADQERIANSIRGQLEIWREAHRQGQDLSAVFKPVWDSLRTGIEWTEDDAVLLAAKGVLNDLVVLELNSVTGENLEYDEKPGRHVIAVGGNRLSRGLTLEGLTISYFLRTASMCDTLLQMARWLGFRHGYEDLIRIWTTDGIARWFAELALVEQSLRDSIVALERAGRRPNQMAIRLRAHSDLLLTARNKSATALKQQDSWSGEHPQTVLLTLSDRDTLQTNFDLTDQFVRNVSPWVQCRGGLLAHDVAPSDIVTFLRRYHVHEDIVVFRPDVLADWIIDRVSAGELVDWSVFVASPGDAARRTMLGDQPIGLVQRSRISSESIGILTDPAHEGVDLESGPDAYKRESGAYDAEAMRAARPANQGLLIIYPLDSKHLGMDDPDAVIALALSLPKTSDVGAMWVVNSMVPNG